MSKVGGVCKETLLLRLRGVPKESYAPGKPKCPGVCEASAPGSISMRLFVTDKSSGRHFLVDTGAQVSIIAKSSISRHFPPGISLHAANGTEIPTYGVVRETIDLGLRRHMPWNFFIADIPYSILGADVLRHFDLLPDLKRRRLVDNLTQLHVSGTLQDPSCVGVSAVDPSLRFAHILVDFPRVLGLEPPSPLHEREVFYLSLIHISEPTRPY